MSNKTESTKILRMHARRSAAICEASLPVTEERASVAVSKLDFNQRLILIRRPTRLSLALLSKPKKNT